MWYNTNYEIQVSQVNYFSFSPLTDIDRQGSVVIFCILPRYFDKRQVSLLKKNEALFWIIKYNLEPGWSESEEKSRELVSGEGKDNKDENNSSHH